MNKKVFTNPVKSFYKFLQNNVSSIAIFIFIIIVVVLIDVYGTDISTNTVNVILAVGASASTYFLYLAFKENKKSNVLIKEQNKILQAQSKYNDYRNEINELREKGNRLIFSDNDSKFIADKYNAPLSETNYFNFFQMIYTFYSIIENDSCHQKYIKNLTSDKIIDIIDENDYFKLDNLIHLHKIIKTAFINERSWIREIMEKYSEILSYNFITNLYKKQLFSDLDEICESYFDYCIQIPNSEYAIRQYGLQKNAKGTSVVIIRMKEYSQLISKFYDIILEYKNQCTHLEE